MSKLHTVFPQDKKAEYLPSDTVEFKLSFEGRKYKKNSLRISGSLQIQQAAATIVAAATNMFYDSSTGVHGFFSEFATNMEQVGIIENISNYPRLYKMKEVARITKSGEISSAKNLCELKMSSDGLTNKAMGGAAAADYALPFSFHPDICMNNVDNDISFTKSGAVNIRTRVEAQNKTLWGSGSGVSNVVKILDMQLQYETVPDDGKVLPIIMSTTHALKQVIDSSNAHVSTTIPAVCTAVSASFLLASKDADYAFNQTELDEVPGVSRIQFSWNDMTTGYLSFPLEDREEILYNYLESMGSRGNNQIYFKKLANGKNYCVGLKFPSPTDLSNQSLGIEVTSDIGNTTPYYIFMVFRAIQKL